MMSCRSKHLLVFIFLLLSAATISTEENKINNENSKNKGTENTTDYRLPDNIIPSEYFIHLTPFIIPDNFTFKGAVKIIASVKKTTANVVLHTDQLEIHDVTVSEIKESGSPVKVDVKETVETKKYQFLNLIMNSSLNAGANISIEIFYTGILNTDMYGFFRNSYKTENETRWVIATQMEPTGARRVFPCFDEPALKAVFHISVDLPKNYTALSNMPIKKETNDLVEFEKTPIMSTYLVAVALSEFQSIQENDQKGRLYKVWANAHLTDQLPLSLSVMGKAIDFFESHLTLPYPLTKLEMIAVQDFPSVAMENWGLQVYSELVMLYNANHTPLDLKRYIRGLITHEISHQWFGNLVTPKWWDYLWLKEGFAEYFEYHAHKDAILSQTMQSQFVVSELHEAFSVDASISTHPVTHKVYSPDEIKSIFDSISYNKGACLLRMLEKLLGPKMFYGGLQRYLEKNQYSTGTPELLFSSIEEEITANSYKLNASVTEIMNTWTLQPGFPVIHAHFDGDSVTLKQNRFFLQPSENVTDQSVWFVPLNWATRSNPNFNDTGKIVWLSENVTTIKIENAVSDWVIFNIQQSGFYRVNYDEQMWKRILNVLKSKEVEVIHEVNRAALIDDLFSLGRVGMVDYNIVLSSLQYLTKEKKYVPWRAAFRALSFLKKRFVGHPEIYKYYKVCVLSTLEPNYKRLGFSEIEKEEDFDVLLRESVLTWMCNLQHKDCINKSLDIFNTELRNDSYKISPNLQGLIYCTVIKHGSTQEWNYLWKKFEKSIFASERVTILSALACSQDATNLEKLLSSIFTSEYEIRKQDIKEIVSSIVESSHVGVQTMIDFVDANSNKISDYFRGESTIQNILSTISDGLSTDELIHKFSSFIDRNSKKMAQFSESLQNSLRNSVYELDWYKKNSPKILEWLKANYPVEENI